MLRLFHILKNAHVGREKCQWVCTVFEQYLNSSFWQQYLLQSVCGQGACTSHRYLHTAGLWTLSLHKHLVLSLVFICVFHVLVLGWLRHRPPAPLSRASSGTVLWEPVGDCHGEAEDSQANAVHLRGNGNVWEEGAVPTHQRAAALKVFNDVEDLLALGLPHHPSYVQQGGDVLLPVGRKDEERKRGETGVNGNRVCLVSLKSVITMSHQWHLSES